MLQRDRNGGEDLSCAHERPAVFHRPFLPARLPAATLCLTNREASKKMCGRFSLTAKPEEMEAFFALPASRIFRRATTSRRRSRSCSSSPAPGDRARLEPARPPRHAGALGPDPRLDEGPERSAAHFNARSETAAEKASFKAAMRHRRVLMPASGFYEWRRDGDRTLAGLLGEAERQGGIVAFGGLMETYAEPGGSEIDTAAILTTAASPRHRPHPRPHAGGDQAGGFRAMARLPQSGAARRRAI